MGLSLFDIGNISMGVAWMIGSALVFIFKDMQTGLIFMGAGFITLLFLRAMEYTFIEHMDGRARGKW